MGAFLTLLFAAICRGLLAEEFGRGLEFWFATHFPALSGPACAALGVVIGVILVELAALAIVLLIRRVREWWARPK